MTTITVNGTSIQTAINAAAVDDDIDVRGSGTYAAFDVTKRLKVHGNGTAKVAGPNYPIRVKSTAGGSLIEGFASISGSTLKNAALVLVENAHDVTIQNNVIEDGAQYGIRGYQSDRITAIGNTIRRVAGGIEIHRNGANSIFRKNILGPINKMITDDGGPGTNGGSGFQLYDSAAGILIEDNDITGARAKTVGGSSWKYDGGAFEGYGVCGKATFRLNRIRDCVNIMEVGTDANHPGVPTDWVIEDNEVWGNPGDALGEDKGCVGFFLRSNNRMIIQRNKAHELDDFFIKLSQGGIYTGEMTGNVVRDNDIWVKPGNSLVYGKNRAYVVDQVIVPANWGKIDGNRVYFDAAVSPEVAYYGGKGATKDLTTWKSWTGWGTGETWGTTPVPPPPPPPPIDPCISVKAERDAAIAQRDAAIAATNTALGQLATANTALAAANARIAAAKAALG